MQSIMLDSLKKNAMKCTPGKSILMISCTSFIKLLNMQYLGGIFPLPISNIKGQITYSERIKYNVNGYE